MYESVQLALSWRKGCARSMIDSLNEPRLDNESTESRNLTTRGCGKTSAPMYLFVDQSDLVIVIFAANDCSRLSA